MFHARITRFDVMAIITLFEKVFELNKHVAKKTCTGRRQPKGKETHEPWTKIAGGTKGERRGAIAGRSRVTNMAA